MYAASHTTSYTCSMIQVQKHHPCTTVIIFKPFLKITIISSARYYSKPKHLIILAINCSYHPCEQREAYIKLQVHNLPVPGIPCFYGISRTGQQLSTWESTILSRSPTYERYFHRAKRWVKATIVMRQIGRHSGIRCLRISCPRGLVGTTYAH